MDAERTAVKNDIGRLEAKMEAKFESVDAKLESFKLPMAIKMGGMFVVAIGVLTALLKFIH